MICNPRNETVSYLGLRGGMLLVRVPGGPTCQAPGPAQPTRRGCRPWPRLCYIGIGERVSSLSGYQRTQHIHVGVLGCVPHVALEGPLRDRDQSVFGDEERKEEPGDTADDRAAVLELVVPVVELLDIPLLGNEGEGAGG